EAVEAAKENAEMNGLDNTVFLTGDVLKTLESVEEKPDLIILDPPRDGCAPKALSKILDYGVKNIIYISCKITSLERDLKPIQEAGYSVVRAAAVDMFPGTGGVETVCLLSNRKPDARVKIDVDLEDYYRIKDEQKKNKASE
ncbi:MAG: 23S rRNA (uracil-5-)-methyltransferase RumA, partial [Oribacterium sp.]|nr:23S rRNA (uracil-5-)-methyltransferase RumA [Oribacterium sp.]